MEQKNEVDKYIESKPEAVKEILTKIRKIIKKIAPNADEGMGYGMPAYKLKGPLIYFAAFPKHIGIYPTPVGIEAFKKELAGYKTGKGSVQLPLDKPIPYDLIKRIIAFNIKHD